MQGWVSIHRQIVENWIWKEKPFSQGQAWIDLLLLANHSENKVPLGNEIVTVKSGAFITSELKLMDRWGWSKTKVRRFLNLLISDGMIVKKSDRKKTTITIVKYGFYQNLETTEEPIKNHRKTDKRPIKDTNNNDNNENNVNKDHIYSVHFNAFWKVYPRKKEKAKAYKAYRARLKDGFSDDELLRAATAYAEECSSRNTDERFIKLGATFLSANTPIEDYLKGGKADEQDNVQDRGSASDYYGELFRQWKSNSSELSE